VHKLHNEESKISKNLYFQIKYFFIWGN